MTKTLLLALLLPALFLAGGCQGSAPKGGESGAAADLRLPTGTFPALDGGSHTLQAGGRPTVLVFWATWCAPCIREMPTLDDLQADLGGDRLHVVALSMDREGEKVARPFVEKNGWSNLDLYVSDGTSFARDANVRGLPTTLIIGPDGTEVARLEGTAEWNADDIKDMLTSLMVPAG